MGKSSDYFVAYWRAFIGRLPKGMEERFRSTCSRFEYERVHAAVDGVRAASLRRTSDRWRLFLAFFGEEP